jgi:hypothetical protein
MDNREWYASGKERKPGNLLKYALIVLTAVAFAAVAIVTLIFGGGKFGTALLYGLLAAVIAGVIGVIFWFVYRAVALKEG